MEKQLHISLAPETIFIINGINITNSMLTTVIVSVILIFFAKKAASNARLSPSSVWQQLAELIIEMMESLTSSIAGKFAPKIFPLVTTIFLFIITSNWIGLVPGVGSIYVNNVSDHSLSPVSSVEAASVVEEPDHNVPQNADHANEEESSHQIQDNPSAVHEEKAHLPPPLFRAPSADVNMTLALALIAFCYTQYTGIAALGTSVYMKKFFDFTNPINAFVGILEFIGEFSKIISYTFRLFGNIFAGEVLLAVMAFLSPTFFPILPLPFLGLELFVGFIQAYVFAILVTIFATLARESHDEAHH